MANLVRRKTIAVLITAFILVGLLAHVLQLYIAAREVELTEMSVSSLKLEGFPLPSKLSLILDLHIKNPTATSIELEDLHYIVYVNDVYLFEGYKERILIPAQTESIVKIPAETTASDLLNLIRSLMLEGGEIVEVEVRGTVNVPIKFLGAVKLFSVTIPFDLSKNYTLFS